MIYMFRKGVKQWKLILWPVLLSLGLSSLLMIRSGNVASVASVNGRPITVKAFRQRYDGLQNQISEMRRIAHASGMQVDAFLKMCGIGDPRQTALDGAIMSQVIEGVTRPFALSLHEDVVSEELIKALPPGFVTPSGDIDAQAYRRHTQQNHISISEFEDMKEQEIRHGLYDEMAKHAAYIPSYQLRADRSAANGKRSFAVATISYDDVLSEVESKGLKDGEAKAYYAAHKDAYRVPEKRTFEVWTFAPKTFEDLVEAPGDVVARFYAKNKTTLYRTKARVKVARIFIESGDDAAARINDLRDELVKNPVAFVAKAEEVSDDKDDVVRDHFERGTYDKDFERAAFRLKDADEISPVIATEKGFEIIQLLDRIKAVEKPLEDVRDSVEKAVRGKRAVEYIRSRLELVRKRVGNFEKAHKELTDHADSHTTYDDMLAETNGVYGEKRTVASHGFRLRKTGTYGFALNDGVYTLILYKDRKVSHVPAREAVVSEIEKDLFAQKAHAEVARLARQIHAEVLRGTSLVQAAEKKDGVSVDTVSDIACDDTSTAPFKDARGMLKDAFELNGSKQALLHTSGNDAFVVQMTGRVDSEQMGAEVASDEMFDAITKEEGGAPQTLIASLLRSATIEVNEAMLQTR